MKTSDKVYQIIKENTGIYFREICRKLNKQNGVIQYNLQKLIENDEIKSIKDGRYRRYFANNENVEKQKAMCLFKRERIKDILLILIDEKQITIEELAKQLNITKQAINWNIKKIINLKNVLKRLYHNFEDQFLIKKKELVITDEGIEIIKEFIE